MYYTILISLWAIESVLFYCSFGIMGLASAEFTQELKEEACVRGVNCSCFPLDKVLLWFGPGCSRDQVPEIGKDNFRNS